MSAKNIYSNSLVTIPVTIPEGDTSSEYVNLISIQDPAGQVAGKAELVAIILPSNFPQGSNVFFSDKQTEDGDPAFILLADGTDSGYLQIPVIVSETQDRNKIPLFPYWFLSSGLVSLHCSLPMPEDVVVEFVLQPIIQSVA